MGINNSTSRHNYSPAFAWGVIFKLLKVSVFKRKI